MKKLVLFLALSMVLFSCKGDPGENGVSWHTQSFAIKSADWKLFGKPGELGSHYYVDVDIPKLTNFVFDEGTIIGYIEPEKGVKNGLPYVLHKGAIEGGKEVLWTQTYDYDFAPGGIRFYLTFSDFETQSRPDDEIFHIVLMW